MRTTRIARCAVLVFGAAGLIVGCNGSHSVRRVPAAAAVPVGNTDGCDRSYGTASQCIPLVAPGGGQITCAYLTAGGFFKTPLLIHRDPLHLLEKKGLHVGTSGEVPTISACVDG